MGYCQLPVLGDQQGDGAGMLLAIQGETESHNPAGCGMRSGEGQSSVNVLGMFDLVLVQHAVIVFAVTVFNMQSQCLHMQDAVAWMALHQWDI